MRRQPPAWQPTREEIEQIKRALRDEAHPPAARTDVGAAVRRAA
jgi:hypothetical protein